MLKKWLHFFLKVFQRKCFRILQNADIHYIWHHMPAGNMFTKSKKLISIEVFILHFYIYLCDLFQVKILFFLVQFSYFIGVLQQIHHTFMRRNVTKDGIQGTPDGHTSR